MTPPKMEPLGTVQIGPGDDDIKRESRSDQEVSAVLSTVSI